MDIRIEKKSHVGEDKFNEYTIHQQRNAIKYKEKNLDLYSSSVRKILYDDYNINFYNLLNSQKTKEKLEEEIKKQFNYGNTPVACARNIIQIMRT